MYDKLHYFYYPAIIAWKFLHSRKKYISEWRQDLSLMETNSAVPVEISSLWKVQWLVLVVLDGCTLQADFYEVGNASRCMHAGRLGSKGH